MGSFLAKIAYYLGKFDLRHVGHDVEECINRAVRMNTMGRSSVPLHASSIGLIVVDGVRCVRSFFGDGLQ
jgi:hypothetical protein